MLRVCDVWLLVGTLVAIVVLMMNDGLDTNGVRPLLYSSFSVACRIASTRIQPLTLQDRATWFFAPHTS